MKPAPVETRLTEAQLRDLTASLPHLVWTCLATGPCDYLSEQWVAYTGLPERQQLGFGWLMQLHPDDRERVKQEWGASVGASVPFDIEFRIRRHDGAYRWFKTRAIPLRDQEGRVVKWYGSNTDIDNLKQAEHEVRRLNEQLERLVEERTAELTAANRELEAFSYSVAHDLRAPLRGISGFAQILIEDHKHALDAEGIDCLERVHRSALQMAAVIDALLSLSRVTRVGSVRQNTDLTALARSVVDEVAAADPARRVSVRVEDRLSANADAVLARTLLQNLVGNAWKFTAKVVEPKIEVGFVHGSRPQTFFVRDNGAGFKMAHADKLFVPFQRLHATGEFPGTGIGLATARRIVDRHGGRIWAEGEVGAGATFYFTLAGSKG